MDMFFHLHTRKLRLIRVFVYPIAWQKGRLNVGLLRQIYL